MSNKYNTLLFVPFTPEDFVILDNASKEVLYVSKPEKFKFIVTYETMRVFSLVKYDKLRPETKKEVDKILKEIEWKCTKY